MHSLRNGILATAAAALMFGSLSFAQMNAPAGGDTKTTSGSVSAADRHFMEKAAQGGMAEVELGQLAQQNGGNQQVKDFGKRMVDDHTKANDQLKQLASQKGVGLPTSLDAKDQATKNKLSKLQGDAFDKAYMRDMVMDHKKDVAEFKQESMSAHDPDLKSWAGETLPTLESHLQEAEKIAPGKSSMMGKNSPSDKTTTAQQQ